jgi:hypothetical protein
MIEDDLFRIQNEQLDEEVLKLRFIATNINKVTNLLRLTVAEANVNYLSEPDRRAQSILRGQDITSALNAVVHELQTNQ